MANNTNGNPFLIDTPTACNLFSGKFQLFNLYWASATVGDTLIVQDGAGTQRLSAVGTTGPLNLNSDQGLFFNGLIVPTLTAGTLYLVVKRQ